MLLLEVGCAGPKGTDFATKHCKHGTTQTRFVVKASFSGRVSESLSDNIQRGALRNKMAVTSGHHRHWKKKKKKIRKKKNKKMEEEGEEKEKEEGEEKEEEVEKVNK
jgi:hypothetical protein